jgi:signal transduction histidine kinase
LLVVALLAALLLKFTERGEVGLSLRNRSNGVVASVASDTGIVIPRDQIPPIFDQFRQLDGSLARPYEGISLGLIITENLAELIGEKLTSRVNGEMDQPLR